MEKEYEIIEHNKIKHIKVLINKITYRAYHLHSDMELIYTVKGSGTVKTKKNEYALYPGSFTLINSRETHEIDAGGKTVTVIVLQISSHFLDTYYPQLRETDFEDNCLDHISSVCFPYILELSKAYFSEEPAYELTCVSCGAKLLSIILQNSKWKTSSGSEYNWNKQFQQRTGRILSYVEENYQMNVKLSDIAEKENLSVTYLSHLFTDTIGVSFQEYLADLRFEHAVRLLPDESLSVSEIAAQSGFSELKYMNTVFIKKRGMKPKDLRKLLAEKSGHSNASPQYTPEYVFSPKESAEFLKDL